MNIESALVFLREHQPMPDRPGQELLERFRAITEFLYHHPDPRAIPLLINGFALWDDDTIGESVQSVLGRFAPDQVLLHLRCGLVSPHFGVRFWSADTAAKYPDPTLLGELSLRLAEKEPLMRIVAARAIERVGGGLAKVVAQRRLPAEDDEDVIEILMAIIGHSSSRL